MNKSGRNFCSISYTKYKKFTVKNHNAKCIHSADFWRQIHWNFSVQVTRRKSPLKWRQLSLAHPFSREMVQFCLLLLRWGDHTGQTGTQRWQFLEGDVRREVFEHTVIFGTCWYEKRKLTSLEPQYSFLIPGHNLLQTLIWDWSLLVHQANMEKKKDRDSIPNWNKLEFWII